MVDDGGLAVRQAEVGQGVFVGDDGGRYVQKGEEKGDEEAGAVFAGAAVD